jgi:hypothetical protein
LTARTKLPSEYFSSEVRKTERHVLYLKREGLEIDVGRV